MSHALRADFRYPFGLGRPHGKAPCYPHEAGESATVSANVEQSGFVGRVLGGRWVVGEQLGSGSFGVVHAGVEKGTGLAVAVKLLHPQFLHHGETIARFWNEAEALRRMNHPNVLSLLDVGVTEDGVPFLVTELLTGETLRDLLNREGALPAERAMRLLGPAAHALHHAHLAGIVHRDLKPENIFRVRKDGMGTTKILDFGVAKLLDTAPGKKLSQTGIMIGTMAYSPPEQMQGLADIDHRADQFGFAALMFEALTGRRPFPHQQPFALFQAVMSGPRPKATELRPELPKAVDAVLIRALDPDREKRYRTVEEFYLQLTQALTMPSFPDVSTTFNGAQPAPVAPGSQNRIPAAVPFERSAPPPPRPMTPPVGELSARYRPIEEENTRGMGSEGAANAGSTMLSGMPRNSPSVSPSPQTTLAEGRPMSRPPAANVTLQSGLPASRASEPLAPSAPPPASQQPVQWSSPPPPQSLGPSPTNQAIEPAPSPPKSSGAWIAIVVVVLIALGVVAWRVFLAR